MKYSDKTTPDFMSFVLEFEWKNCSRDLVHKLKWKNYRNECSIVWNGAKFFISALIHVRKNIYLHVQIRDHLCSTRRKQVDRLPFSMYIDSLICFYDHSTDDTIVLVYKLSPFSYNWKWWYSGQWSFDIWTTRRL